MNKQFLTLLLTALVIGTSGCQDDSAPKSSNSLAAVPGAERIILHLEYSYGVGGYVEPVYRPYLLFGDGTIYKNLDTSIDKLDLAKSKKEESKHWGTWRKEGDDYIVSMNSGEAKRWEASMVFPSQPAKEGERISGTYRSVTGGGNVAFGGDVLVFSTNSLSFDGDKFTFETVSGGSSAAATAYQSQERAGTYRLDGYTIVLKFNNGKEERKFFYFYPDSKRVFGMGTRYYVER